MESESSSVYHVDTCCDGIKYMKWILEFEEFYGVLVKEVVEILDAIVCSGFGNSILTRKKV